MKNNWPQLNFDELKDTITTVQLYTQIVGKIRLVKMPWLNHSWHVTLYVSARGLTTSSIPYEDGVFQIEFDFIDHKLLITTSTGKSDHLELDCLSVADFYKMLFKKLQLMGVNAIIYP